MDVAIVKPSITYERTFIDMVADFDAHDPENAAFYAAAKEDFGKYVQSLLDEESGVNLAEGRVRCTHRWLIDRGGAVVGVTRLRHSIRTPFLATDGGHIGYDVAPRRRRMGYGHVALQAALEEARTLQMERVLLVADVNNAPSRRVIERHGGELETIVFSSHWNQHICRYWIPVYPEPAEREESAVAH
jgi:predicted acetyltransferase